MNIVIAMAGEGTRTSDLFKHPKPLIKVHDHPLIAWAMAGLPLQHASGITFIVNSKIKTEINVIDLVSPYLPKTISLKEVVLSKSTSGQAETVYVGTQDLNSTVPIVIFNCDTVISNDFPEDYSSWDGLLGTFTSNNPQMSFVKSFEGKVIQTAEKEVISNQASTGLYYFKELQFFQEAYRATRHVNESFVAPVYNWLIDNLYQIGSYQTKSVLPLGTSAEIDWFNKLPFPHIKNN